MKAKRRRRPAWAGPVGVLAAALVVVLLADAWRTRRTVHRVADLPEFATHPWKTLREHEGLLKGLASGRLAQRAAVKQGARSADQRVRLVSAWALCAAGEGDSASAAIVVRQAMAHITAERPTTRDAAKRLAIRFLNIQMALKVAGAAAVTPLLAVAADSTQSPARRQLAVASLGLIGDAHARAPLVAMLRQERGEVRVQLFTAVAALDAHEAEDDLHRAATSDPNRDYRTVAARAYRRLTGRVATRPTTRPSASPATQAR